MPTPLVLSDKPAVKNGRRPPLLVGLVLLAVAFAGYLGWQHFAHVPTATPGYGPAWFPQHGFPHAVLSSPNAQANLPGPLQRLHAARNQNAAPVKFSDWLCRAELRAKQHFRPRVAPRTVLHQFATVPALLATDNTCHRLTILYDSDRFAIL